MRLFNLDLHISVIADIKDIMTRIAPSVEIVDWSLSGHTWVFNKSPTPVEIINQNTWQHLSLDMIKQFQSHYDNFLSGFDGFIVAHPNVFALLFEKYSKPIFVINSCRYDMPACSTGQLLPIIKELNSCFERLRAKGLLRFISNNLADNAYFLLANPTIPTEIVPSLCLYTGLTWTPGTQSKFLLYSGNAPSHTHIIHRNTLGRFDWKTLMNFRGLIHIPYEASTMSIFEHISSGIPLFFPTKRFFLELISKGTSIQCNYWRTFAKRAPPDYLTATEDPSFWVERADYYNIEGYYYFDSFADLFQQLDNFVDINYNNRIAFLAARKERVFNMWGSMLTDIGNLK